LRTAEYSSLRWGGPQAQHLQSISTQTTNPTDIKILIEIFNSTNGINWINNQNWLNGDPCTPNPWFGVQCVKPKPSPDFIVYAVYMKYNQLVGTIPTNIGLFNGLVLLDLGNNKLSGTIPTTIGSLTHLSYLFLDSNQFSGTIPSSIQALTNLNSVELGNNQLSGTIPIIGSYVALNLLDLKNNQFSGTIPNTLASLVKLTFLDLGSNNLIGTIPPELGSLINLVFRNTI